jgi:hypothetical protein
MQGKPSHDLHQNVRGYALARRDSELGGSDEKLGRLNAYCRAVIPSELAKRIDLTDAGLNFS